MKFAERDPDAGYFDSWLWLPKRHVSKVQIQSALFYGGRRPEDPMIQAWDDAPEHFRVPRNFVPYSAFGSFSFPVYDTRFKDFPKIDVTSNLILDFQNPALDFQRRGVDALTSELDGILCLRCGAGKTPTALHAATVTGHPILVIINEGSLIQQWTEDIEWVLNLPKGAKVGQIGAGKFDWEHEITIAMVNTLANRIREGRLPSEMLRHFDPIIVDECHMLGAPYFNSAIPPFPGRRWGISATPTRNDQFDSLIQYTIGRVKYSYLMPELKPNVYFLRLETRPPQTKKAIEAVTDVKGDFHHLKCYGYLAEDRFRTEAIVAEIRVAIAHGRQVLVLTHSRKMCEALEPYFPQGGVVHGDIKPKNRFDIIKNANPLIAIMQVGKQALNKPGLDTLFVCDPYTNPNVLQQTMGRLLRIFAGKKSPSVIFAEDYRIDELRACCGSIKKTLGRWPISKGGAIGWRVIQPGRYKEQTK